MPDDEVEALRRWARGDFYPLSPNDGGGDQVDRLANEMAPQPNLWWLAFKEVFAEADKPSVENLMMPFAALLEKDFVRLADRERLDERLLARAAEVGDCRQPPSLRECEVVIGQLVPDGAVDALGPRGSGGNTSMTSK